MNNLKKGRMTMSGWMKYPHQECLDCDKYDPDEDEEWAIVNHPNETCDSVTEDCPMRGKEKVS
jgi:hypothetical protein